MRCGSGHCPLKALHTFFDSYRFAGEKAYSLEDQHVCSLCVYSNLICLSSDNVCSILLTSFVCFS